jgi:hypothetical protein
MATITINGTLVNDQTAGIQFNDPDGDDVAISLAAGVFSSADLHADFIAFLNGLTLSAEQEAFADSAEAASQAGLITVTPAANEVVDALIFAPLTNVDSGLNTVGGEDIFLTTSVDGKSVLAIDASGDIVAAFYMIPNVDNTSATVQMVTFAPIAHPDTTNPDDRLDFSDVLKVRALTHVDESIGDDLEVDDDGPSIILSGTEPTLAVDETVLADNATQNFAGAFTPDFGTDGAGTTGGIEYALSAVAGPSGLVDTATNDAVILVNNGGVIEGRTETSNDLVFTVTVAANGDVTLDQIRAVRHGDTTSDDEDVSLTSDDLVTLTATITDGDGDPASQALNIGHNLVFGDDGPSIVADGTPPVLTVDESDFGTDDTKSFAGVFTALSGADGPTPPSAGVTYALSVGGVGATGLVDTVNGQAVTLAVVAGVIVASNADGDEMFTISVAANGDVTLNQSRAVGHPDAADPNDPVTLASDDLVTLTATATDGDGDTDSASINIGKTFTFLDDAPEITAAPDGDPGTAGIQNETLTNALATPATGVFAYDIGSDAHNAAFYAGGGSDFADLDPTAAVNRLLLTGTVDNAQNPAITNVVTSLVSETTTTAVFDFDFSYDKDPITAGVQSATAGGSLTFNKVAGTYSIVLDDVIDGFSFNVFHSAELTAKAPPGNTGHPELVVTQLDENNGTTDTDGFYVQFTANTTTNQVGFFTNTTGADNNTGNAAWLAGEFVANNHIDWVSATQTTNGVAGDTIQKGELLTLRFFNENILGDVDPSAPGGGTEKLSPTDAVDAIAIKFDGIGNSEDLIVVLDLIDYGADGVLGGGDDIETTKSVIVDNADLYKGNTVPSPYNAEFPLDNNDALLIIESNDYNVGSENFQIQGMQIMQSGNGLSGTGINLNRVTDDPNTVTVEGASTSTKAWENTDNDVLKIVDIGFIQSTSGQIGADLDFAFAIQDSDGDTTATQHLLVDVIA